MTAKDQRVQSELWFEGPRLELHRPPGAVSDRREMQQCLSVAGTGHIASSREPPWPGRASLQLPPLRHPPRDRASADRNRPSSGGYGSWWPLKTWPQVCFVKSLGSVGHGVGALVGNMFFYWTTHKEHCIFLKKVQCLKKITTQRSSGNTLYANGQLAWAGSSNRKIQFPH